MQDWDLCKIQEWNKSSLQAYLGQTTVCCVQTSATPQPPRAFRLDLLLLFPLLFMLFCIFLKDLRANRSLQNECNCFPAVRCCVSSTPNLCTVPLDKQHQMSFENHILFSFSPLLTFEALALCESDSLSPWMPSESPFWALSQHPCTTSYSFPMIICISFGRP